MWYLTAISMKWFDMIKGGVSAWAETATETIKNTVSGTKSALWDTISWVATSSKEYLSSTVKNIPWYFNEWVVDKTKSDLAFTWFKTNPLGATLKALATPITLLPRVARATTKSVWSVAWNTIIGAPKRALNTTWSVIWWAASLTGAWVKTLTGTARVGLDAIDGFVDGAKSRSSKPSPQLDSKVKPLNSQPAPTAQK